MKQTKQYLILDFYVDEPACFGVPPFVSPYPRYIYGALLDAGVSPSAITYMTVAMLRSLNYLLQQRYDTVFLVGGAVVPGKYLGHKIGTVEEIEKTVISNSDSFFAAGGLAARQITGQKSYPVVIVDGDIEQYAFDSVRGEGDSHRMRSYNQLNRWAVLGAGLLQRHPFFPSVICEIETYRGCPRSSHCSFCSEHIFDTITFRKQIDILAEVDALIDAGVTRFRIGRQADILAYGSRCEIYKASFPKPEVDEVVSLFLALEERKRDGKIEVLNVDNANPGTVAHFEQESHDILSAIASAVTPGDTLPLGVESLDPVVIERNNLKVDTETLLRVVTLMNSAGGWREEGIPKLLPGINLIHGLPGETMNTFKYNYEALMDILSRGLLLRRINIRTLLPFPGTGMTYDASKRVINRYRYYREKIRDEVDAPMLRKVFPSGSLLSSVRVEECRNGVSYCRQIASYAITVKVRQEIPVGTVASVIVCGHEPRSLRGFLDPLDINKASLKLLESIEGIGKKRAQTLVLNRPFAAEDEFSQQLESVPPLLRGRIKLLL
ncbi:MAG: radical SAM protein [Spirochaetes bacterium]|jgi:radical SAM superfamily enzyme with C-terminal helix-hairpin-helix motif|nr:radical SAM protein [Spirochaetota bacterium]